jgi:hypothetical protein
MRRGEERGAWPHKLAAEPTKAAPGTKAKLAVMIARVERGEYPMHPDDATQDETDVSTRECICETGEEIDYEERERAYRRQYQAERRRERLRCKTTATTTD